MLVIANHAETRLSGEACAWCQIQVIYKLCKCGEIVWFVM